MFFGYIFSKQVFTSELWFDWEVLYLTAWAIGPIGMKLSSFVFCENVSEGHFVIEGSISLEHSDISKQNQNLWT